MNKSLGQIANLSKLEAVGCSSFQMVPKGGTDSQHSQNMWQPGWYFDVFPHQFPGVRRVFWAPGWVLCNHLGQQSLETIVVRPVPWRKITRDSWVPLSSGEIPRTASWNLAGSFWECCTNSLSGWWFQHVSTSLKNMKVSWDVNSQYM